MGVDIVAIARIKRLLKKYNISFLQNFLCESEIALCVKNNINLNDSQLDSRSESKSDDIDSRFFIERIAGFYAAKEAIAKALRCGISKNLAFKDIILSKDFQGAPKAKLKKRAKKHFKVKKIHISISHDKAKIYDKNARGKDSQDSRDKDLHKDLRDSHNIAPQGFAIAIAIIKRK